MSNVRLLSLDTYVDRRGRLTTVEKEPFDVKRAFWLYDLKDKRGDHGHETCHQLIIAVQGKIWVSAGNWNGWLDKPDKGLYVPPGNMIKIYGEHGTVLVLCSEYYDPNEYTKGETA